MLYHNLYRLSTVYFILFSKALFPVPVYHAHILSSIRFYDAGVLVSIYLFVGGIDVDILAYEQFKFAVSFALSRASYGSISSKHLYLHIDDAAPVNSGRRFTAATAIV